MQTKKIHKFVSIISVFGLGIALFSGIMMRETSSAATGDVELSGWAWSEVPPGGLGLGWISFNSGNAGGGGGDYKVYMNPSNGRLSGNAWTLNGYTLTFEEGELGGCPSNPCRATYNSSTGRMSGWAKFKYSGGDAGGWTGWLSLSGDGYGVVGTEANGITTFSGRAFGGDVAGWVSFDGVTTGPVTPTGFDYSLSNSGDVSITKGSSPVSGYTDITKTLISSSTEAVTLSLTGAPAGVSYSFSAQGCAPRCVSRLLFTVDSTAPNGNYGITVTGTPLDRTTSLTLTIGGSNGPTLSCVASPVSSVRVGQRVTWTANVSGGSAPYTYTWSGTNIPTSPAPTTNPFSIIYTTVGLKTAQATVRDSAGRTSTCNPAGSVYVNFDPKFEEF